MDTFVARANIAFFKKQLAVEPGEAERQQLWTLLTEEEAKLADLETHLRSRSRLV
jgi:hypothetical protein